jgi:hypothetical protein
LGELVGELTQGTAEGVVFLIIHWVLQEVPLADLMFAVIAVGFVVVEVDLPEKSAKIALLVLRFLGFYEAVTILMLD